MRRLILACATLIVLSPLAAVNAAVNVNIGIDLPGYPQLVEVPGYPVYYDPDVDANYFFYDGRYWVYQDDNWYSSEWYNGPWELVEPEYVPDFILRVPVRYYRRPPAYFHGWRADAAPHWSQHWGHGWAERRPNWNHWDRKAAPPPQRAPLPVYQKQYSGERYPHEIERQHELHTSNYHYQPHEVYRHGPEDHGHGGPPPKAEHENEHREGHSRDHDEH